MKNSQGKKGEYAAELVYKVQLANGKSCFYPIHYYCFNSISKTLQKLLCKKGFAENEHWRTRDVPVDQMANGKIWKDFFTHDKKEFVCSFPNYSFMLNFDFFQPVKRRQDYSVGVFDFVLPNLPRAER